MALFTLVHVAISLVGIASGFVVALGLVSNKALPGWTALFLATTVLTSVTGFLFPVRHFMPSHAVGLVSLAVLAVALAARYRFGMRGKWRRVYAIAAVLALYLNVFVLVAQLFQKVPALKAIAPTGAEPPFKAAEGTVLFFFLALGAAAALCFKGPKDPAQA
jgi:hypothetical protein